MTYQLLLYENGVFECGSVLPTSCSTTNKKLMLSLSEATQHIIFTDEALK